MIWTARTAPKRSLTLPASWRQLQQRHERRPGLCQLEQCPRECEHELWRPLALPHPSKEPEDYESTGISLLGGARLLGVKAPKKESCTVPERISRRKDRAGIAVKGPEGHKARPVSSFITGYADRKRHARPHRLGGLFGRAAKSERPHLCF